MRKFDTKVQHLKHRVLREVARHAFAGDLLENISEIPKRIVPGRVPTMRCCVYKERAILAERIKLAMGGDRQNPLVIEVLDIACDECPVGGHEVTDDCRGCLAHQCEEACAKNAISFDSNQKAHIDKALCVECGACAKVCPYSAITSRKRPCESACKVKAIQQNTDKTARIDPEKCIECGACVYQCPFGAIVDKSYILDVIDLIKKSENNTNYKVYAAIAPSIAGQFTFARFGQVLSGIKELGFASVIDVALGADLTADAEARELSEKGFLTSSCCPSFIKYMEKSFPQLKDKVSSVLSPMAMIGRAIKKAEPNAKVVFIGPCTAKKAEFRSDAVRPYIDCVITYEELLALFAGKDIDITTLDDIEIESASCYGRGFAQSGGVIKAVEQALRENGLESFEYKPISCSGIEDCRKALLKANAGKLDANFIEGMACAGGCIAGAGCLTHSEKNYEEVEKYSESASIKTIRGAIKTLS